jgi:glycosyltransferase involved in cell wall biosynthesis
MNSHRFAASVWIVCMGGEDWWYHSHAHFDIQVMKRLSGRCRVLYICSIGMRMPSLRRDAQFWARIGNKLCSVGRALRQVQPNLWVYSPLPLPLYQWNWGRACNRALLAAQLRTVMAWLNIERPLLWINTPTGWPVVRDVGHHGLVYQRTDEYAEYNFDNFNSDYVRSLDEELLEQADLVLHVDPDLHARSRSRARSSLLLEQGVDERFLDPVSVVSWPADLPHPTGPIVGYAGTLEPHKFDAELVKETAIRLPDCTFVIVGPHHENAGRLRALKNVHFIGAKRHEEILPYLRAFDVCMLPTARTEWGLHCKPIKLMEYLAAGRPVVATDTPGAHAFAEAVHIADSAQGWATAIKDILSGENRVSGELRHRLASCSWNRQVDRIGSELMGRGLMGSRPLVGAMEAVG